MNRIFTLLSRAGLNGFFLLILVMIGLAWLFPESGATESQLRLREIGNIGVAVIFFFYGLKLNPSKLLSDLGHWKMHLVIQGTTFLLFPMVILLTRQFFYTDETDLLWLGTFYLAALPSTVSSSVVMVSIAGGNVSSAIFNASISSLLGIFITPLWMNLFLTSNDVSASDLSEVILNLCLQVLLPVLIGLALHKQLGFIAERFKKQLRYFDQTIILLIVFRAFSDSFLSNMFDGYSIMELIVLGILMLLLFFIMVAIMHLLALRMGFSREDRITVIFCGSKKSLVQGAVMGQVLFVNPVVLGIILLPLMLYHSLQLIAGSILAQQLARNKVQR